jgi:hypothetical protein
MWLLFRRRPAIGRAAALGAGFAVPWLGAWAIFSHLGVWDDLVYYAFRWTTQMYVPTGFAEFSLISRFFGKVGPWLLLLVVPWTLAGRALVRAWRGEDEPELTGLLGFWTACAMVMVCLGGRFYDHYFPAPVLPLSALAALGVATIHWHRRGLLRLVAAGTALPVAACFVLALTFEKSMLLLGERPRGPYLEVARYIQEHTRPDDPVFVWGYFPLIYVAADRLAGSRFVGCHYLTGYAALGLGRQVSPAVEERLQVPGGFDQLILDLEERKPALFVDTAPADLHFWSRYPLSRYPRLAAYVAEHYVREAEVDGTILYRRSSE